MCTGIVESTRISGSGKGPKGWFTLEQAHVSYDHPYHAPLEHALNIDFVNESEGPGARVAVELTPESAIGLARAILASLSRGGVEIQEGTEGSGHGSGPAGKKGEDLTALSNGTNGEKFNPAG